MLEQPPLKRGFRGVWPHRMKLQTGALEDFGGAEVDWMSQLRVSSFYQHLIPLAVGLAGTFDLS